MPKGGLSVRFSRLRLENWRNFAEVDVFLQDRVFLVGPNASGKSNFLDVFRFLRDVASPGGGLQEAIGRRGGISRIRCLAPGGRSGVTIDVEIGDSSASGWRYLLTFGLESRRKHQPQVRREVVWSGGTKLLERPDTQDKKDPLRLQQTYLEQVTANADFRGIAEFFSSVSYYHIVPQLVRDPDRSAGRHGDPFGGDFLEQIARTSQKTRERRLKRIGQALKVAVPQLSELQLEKDDAGRPHLKGRYQHWRARGAWQSEVDFSDGTLRLLGLLWTLADGNGPILLEEPELSLHPGVVRHIPQMISRVQRRRQTRQVLLSTHSSDLLNDPGIAADEFFLFAPTQEGTQVQSGATHADIVRELSNGLTVAEIYLARTVLPEAQQISLFEG